MCLAFILYRSESPYLEGNSALCLSSTDLKDFGAMLGGIDVEGDGFNGYTYVVFKEGEGKLPIV